MRIKHRVNLSSEERTELQELVKTGKTQAYRIKHANILLLVDENGPKWDDEKTAEAVHCNPDTVRNVRQRFVERGLEAALERKKQSRISRQRILDGEGEARLTQLSCSTPPEGRNGWTLELLGERLVQLNVVESISNQTVMRSLKKTFYNPISRNNG